MAGVSPTTVSRVINNSDHSVSKKARAVVEKAVRELNFEPNRMAQGLVKNKSRIIGVIVHDISDAYFAEIVKGIEKVIFNYDYIINIYNTYRDVDKELHAVNLLRANRAEAVVFAGGTLLDPYYKQKMGEYIKDLKEQGSALIGLTSHPFPIKNIEIGNVLATQTITNYILSKGHKKTAYITGPEILSTTKERFNGYKEALLDRGMEIDKKLVIEGDFTFEGGRKAALELINYLDRITAIVVSNDAMALGLMWELKNQGVEVPGDISVTGIGNIPATKYSYPSLTTISLPTYELGVEVGKDILNSVEDNRIINGEFEVQIKLVERNSVKDIRG